MAIVTIKERSIEGVWNRAVHIYFRWKQAPRLKNKLGSHMHHISSFDWKCKFA